MGSKEKVKEIKEETSGRRESIEVHNVTSEKSLDDGWNGEG